MAATVTRPTTVLMRRRFMMPFPSLSCERVVCAYARAELRTAPVLGVGPAAGGGERGEDCRERDERDQDADQTCGHFDLPSVSRSSCATDCGDVRTDR